MSSLVTFLIVAQRFLFNLESQDDFLHALFIRSNSRVFRCVSTAYRNYYEKIVSGYDLDAILQSNNKSKSKENLLKQAQTFLMESASCNKKQYKSVGCGSDIRLSGPEISGSVLIHNDEIVHAACF